MTNIVQKSDPKEARKKPLNTFSWKHAEEILKSKEQSYFNTTRKVYWMVLCKMSNH